MTQEETKNIEQILKVINNKNSLADITLKDSLRSLQPWESSKHCLRSIFNIGLARIKKRRKGNQVLAFGSCSPTKDHEASVSQSVI